MPCPFARLAALASPADIARAKKHFDYHGHGHGANDAASTKQDDEPLSSYLKHATAKAHREVESSEGVRRLMGLASGSATNDDNGYFAFGRLDYVRWMVMLSCIYAALESSLLQQKRILEESPSSSSTFTTSALAPLLSARVSSPRHGSADLLMHHLLRFRAIMQDIYHHLRVLSSSTGHEEGAGLSFEELMESLEGRCNPSSQELQRAMDSIDQDSLLEVCPSSATDRPLSADRLTSSHISLLTPVQAESTAIYVRRLLAIQNSDVQGSEDVLLAHAYVRYLGDLSGGQHIRKRVEKLWPMEQSEDVVDQDAGFAFYTFPMPTEPAGLTASIWHRQLKDCFRVAMDAGVNVTLPVLWREEALRVQGEEASLAFELNKDLFEGLIGNEPDSVRRPLEAMSQKMPQLTRRDSVWSSDDSSGSTTPSSSSSSSFEDGDGDHVQAFSHAAFPFAPAATAGQKLKPASPFASPGVTMQLKLLYAAHPCATGAVPLALGAVAVAILARMAASAWV